MSSSRNTSSDQPVQCSELALKKAKIVEPLRGIRPIPGAMMIAACQAAGELLGVSQGEVSHQTIRNWLSILETEGPPGFDRKKYKNRGQSKIDPQLETIVEGILLNKKRFSIAETHRRVARYARHFLNFSEDRIPSRKQITYLWEHIPDEKKVLALEGTQAYRRKYDQCVRFEAPYPNAIWQADHHQLDIIVVDPETGKHLGRPWLTKVQDDHSRAIMGYYLSMDYPSSMGVASALYHAFLAKPQGWWSMYGLPEVLYIDNGKDWISQHIELVALSFGIQLERHERYHPQSKGKVERIFRTLEEMCIHPLDGSVGSNLRKRPYKVTPELTLDQVKTHIERFIRDYHERRHSTTKQTPRERWENNRTTHRVVEDLTDIDHLLKSKEYTVQRYGIHFRNRYYRDKEGVLGRFIGRRVTVFFDSRDVSRIRIWGREDLQDRREYICTAHRQSFAPTQTDRDKVAEENRRRRDATRNAVRTSQADGQTALKALDNLDTVQESSAFASVPGVDVPSPSPDSSGSVEVTDPCLSPRNVTSHADAQKDADDELDYTELRRTRLRKLRGEQNL